MTEPAVARDDTAVAKFVERFALDLADAGMPRMAARVFAALLTTDSGAATAGELASVLQVSPASISHAVRYLVHVDMVVREREPGSRRDHYRTQDDIWAAITTQRGLRLVQWEDSLQQGLDALGSETPAGRRMAESLAFFAFLRQELPLMLERWIERRDELRERSQ
jgi:DNA-binding transcriptional regulator GbsR (MarR family)